MGRAKPEEPRKGTGRRPAGAGGARDRPLPPALARQAGWQLPGRRRAWGPSRRYLPPAGGGRARGSADPGGRRQQQRPPPPAVKRGFDFGSGEARAWLPPRAGGERPPPPGLAGLPGRARGCGGVRVFPLRPG